MKMSPSDKDALRVAKQLLENPGLAAKITNVIGTPIEKGLALLPDGWQKKVGIATTKSLNAALSIAIRTMEGKQQDASPWWHKLAVTVSGAGGGVFGLPGLAVELPLSTTIMLRSIADIGRANGENLADVDAQLACLMVFALGGKSKNDDGSDNGYFAIKSALAKAVGEAAQYLVEKGAVEEGVPVLVRLVAQIAARFQVPVGEKMAVMAVPVIGALGGAVVNLLFIDHFQDMSRGHFAVRRLERKYSPEFVQLAYEKL